MKQTIWGVLIILAWVGPAKAWSEDGHRIVCAIAWKEVGTEARTAIERLLEDDPAASFPEACIWADTIRDNLAYDWSRPNHYVNVPNSASSIALARDCPPTPGCVIGAIGTHRGTLSDTDVAPAARA